MNLEEIFFISSNRLKAAEPLMEKYFDYESNMFLDEIKLVVETIDHITIENGIPTVDYLKTFYNTNLAIPISDKLYPREDVADVFPDYFADVDDKDAQLENYKVSLSLLTAWHIFISFKKVEVLITHS
ncbi:hypothetical protein [Dysgonomonas massiliensis]|uniref:hypothetical protein n=1 Tax=Dysgonomonas massiliensis TaxID=2040292 RepID=UPI000C75AC77|nr:hypothetical protein [Dysgonomonas massiliensis]